MAALMRSHRFQAVTYDGPWRAIKYPWHVLDVMQWMLSQIDEPQIAPDALIEEGVLIKGNVVIDSGARLFHGATVVGPAYIGQGAIVGNGALVRSRWSARARLLVTERVARSYMGAGVHARLGVLRLDPTMA